MMEIWQMILSFDAHLPQLVAMHANLVYVILFGVVFLQIGVLPFFFLPSNPFLFVCGAVWAASLLNIWLLVAVLIVAAILGKETGTTGGEVRHTEIRANAANQVGASQAESAEEDDD